MYLIEYVSTMAGSQFLPGNLYSILRSHVVSAHLQTCLAKIYLFQRRYIKYSIFLWLFCQRRRNEILAVLPIEIGVATEFTHSAVVSSELVNGRDELKRRPGHLLTQDVVSAISVQNVVWLSLRI